MNLGKKIIELRKDNKMSQEDLAEVLNVTRQTISNWENGKNYPDIGTLILLSDKFHIPLDILLKGDNKMINNIDNKVHHHHIFKIAIISLIIILIIGISSFLIINNHRNLEIKKKDEEIKELKSLANDMDLGYALYSVNKNNLTKDIKMLEDNISYVDVILSKDDTVLMQKIKVLGLKNQNNEKPSNENEDYYIILEVKENVPNYPNYYLYLTILDLLKIDYYLVENTSGEEYINKDEMLKLNELIKF